MVRDVVKEQWQEVAYEQQMLRKDTEAKSGGLEEEQKTLRGEQDDYRGQLENLLEHFNEQVAKVKALQKELVPSVHLSIQTPNQSQGTLVRGTVGSPIKLIKPPSLPHSQEQTHPQR